MTTAEIKAAILRRFPDAICTRTPQGTHYHIITEGLVLGSLGFGRTPTQAWKDAERWAKND